MYNATLFTVLYIYIYINKSTREREKFNLHFRHRSCHLQQWTKIDFLNMRMKKNLMEQLHYDVFAYVIEDYMIMKISSNNIDIEMVSDHYE